MKYLKLIIDIAISLFWILFAFVVSIWLLPDLAKYFGDSGKYRDTMYAIKNESLGYYGIILTGVPIINTILYVVKYIIRFNESREAK